MASCRCCIIDPVVELSLGVDMDSENPVLNRIDVMRRLSLETIPLYWHTLRYLRPVQLFGRLRSCFPRPRPHNLASSPILRCGSGTWIHPARRRPSLTGPRTFIFLSEPGCLDEIGWNGPGRAKLWRYNQHYFDDLNAAGSEERESWHQVLLREWVEQNQPGNGAGWDPYPTSLRIVNWIKWALADNRLPDECLRSMALQAQWLEKRLETHLLGNHLFANAKALIFAGLFFKGADAQRWFEIGSNVLKREVPEQIQPDGGQFERSTMYHALALEDMLDLYNVRACYADDLDQERGEQLSDWQKRIPQMLDWLHAMSHPDGEIALFNDAAIGIAPSVAELDAYAGRLGLRNSASDSLGASFPGDAGTTLPMEVLHLPDSGYIRVQSEGAVFLIDVAPVGPDYLPGHGHADTLTFELSLFGERFIVNSGTSLYDLSAERLRERGTAAHNTVVVDEHDSSEVWASFRLARRAHPRNLSIGSAAALPLDIRCAHDGYRRLAGKVDHERLWRIRTNELVVEDRLLGNFTKAEARFHFHPRVRVTIDDASYHGRIVLPGNRKAWWRAELGCARLESSTYHPQFGVSEENQCLVLSLNHAGSRLRVTWM